MRVAVFGASGFVGSTLVERMWADSSIDVRPVIHSSGSAARLARFGRPLVMADLMSPLTIAPAVEGCTHVINCSRGPSDMMTRGLQNLVEAARRSGVRRFVHLSSVAVYGDGYSGVLDERLRPQPVRGSYGHTKMLQDRIVANAVGSSLSSIILCPPNISGAYSAFLLEIIETIRRGQLALVEGGDQPCELIDVENLVHAIRLALTAEATDAERIFVTDGPPVMWGEIARALQPFADVPTEQLPSIPLGEAQRLVSRAEVPAPSLRRAMRHLASSEVRQVLKRDAWFARAERAVKTTIRSVSPLEDALRRRFAGSARPLALGAEGPAFSTRLLKQQLRGVTYSQERAHRTLGYSPVLRFQESMSIFGDWYRIHYGWGDQQWPLLRHLRSDV